MKKIRSRKVEMRRKRALRVRRKVRGTKERPRLSVFRSNRHIQAQIIDDEQGHTLAGVSTYSKGMAGTERGRVSKAAGTELGCQLVEKAKALQIERVVLDRGPFKYHGVIAAVADAVRGGGVKV